MLITGESGSGKSVIAHMVGKILKKKGVVSKILHTDNYYTVLPHLRTEWRKENGLSGIGDHEYNFDLLNKHIQAFIRGEKATMPCVDLINDYVDQLTTDFSRIQVLIIEGLYAIKAQADTKVFIDLTYKDTKIAQKFRGKEVLDEFRLQVLEKEHQAIRALRHHAELIITRQLKLISATDTDS